ncbi:MAG: tetratricopeptide repeat protein [Janthinobacterium lividum]
MKPALTLSISALAACLAAGGWALHHPIKTAGDKPLNAAVSMPVPVSAAAAAPPTDEEKLDKIIAKYTQAAARRPHDPRSWTDLGNALMQKARETADLSYYSLAEADYRKALARDPKSVPALTGMAWVTSDRHEFEQSKAWAGRALALDPGSNDAYGLIGDADQEIGDYNAAYIHYQKMLDLRPDLASYSRGGHLLWLTGASGKGAELMVKAIDAGSAYAESTGWCRAQLGLMQWSEGHQDAAEQTLRDARAATPRNYRVLMALGRVEAGRGNYTDAIDSYEKAVDVVPQIEAVSALGDLYALTGRKAGAAQEFTLAEQIDQIQKANGVKGGWQMSLFRANHDRELPEALQDAQDEYKTRKNVYAADTLAWCLYKTGHYSEAAAMSRAALAQHTPEADFNYHAGMIALKQNDVPAARLYLHQALQMNSDFSPIDAPAAAAALKQMAGS